MNKRMDHSAEVTAVWKNLVLTRAVEVETWLKDSGAVNISMDVADNSIDCIATFDKAKTAGEIVSIIRQRPDVIMTGIKNVPNGRNVHIKVNIGKQETKRLTGDSWNDALSLVLTVIAASLFLVLLGSICDSLLNINRSLTVLVDMGNEIGQKFDKIDTTMKQTLKEMRNNKPSPFFPFKMQANTISRKDIEESPMVNMEENPQKETESLDEVKDGAVYIGGESDDNQSILVVPPDVRTPDKD